jgi:hypothetical protein
MDSLKKLFRESLPDAIGGVLSAVFLAIIGLLSGAFGIDTQLSLRLAIAGIFLLFVIGTAYVLAARRQGTVDPRQYYPRFSKKIRVLAVSALVAGTAMMVWALWPYSIPDYPILLVNNTANELSILDKPEISLWLDVALGDDVPLLSGRLELLCDSCRRTTNGEYIIPPESETSAYLRVPNPTRYKQYFESGEVYMILVIKHRNGSWASSGDAIDFDRDAFENYYTPIKLK